MPLPLPNLDTRRWADLVAEGRALIPRYAPTWTDHNATDPGITTIELFAWLIEQDIYRINRIPARHRRKFLALIGFAPQPPQAAQTVLSFIPKPGNSPTLPAADTLVETRDMQGQPLPFHILSDLIIVPLNLLTIQVDSGGGIKDLSRVWQEGGVFSPFGASALASEEIHIVQPGETIASLAQRYEATAAVIAKLNLLPSETVPLRPGQRLSLPTSTALYLGFEQPLPPNQPVNLWFQLQKLGTDRQARDRLTQELSEQAAACQPIHPRVECLPQTQTDQWCQQDQLSNQGYQNQAAAASPTPLGHHSVSTVWEFYADENGGQWRALQPAQNEVLDHTRSLTLSGIVQFKLPGAIKARALGNITEPRYYLRCRLETGQYDAAPICSAIVVNAVLAEQAKLIADHLLGTSTGLPLQQFPLPQVLVQDGKLTLETEQDNIPRRDWQQRPDLDASRRTDWHFALDSTTMKVNCGDGERGRIPAPGSSIYVSYAITKGSSGNVTAQVPWKLVGNQLAEAAIASISNPFPATGGRDAESLENASGQAAAVLWAHERLVELSEQFQTDTLDQLDPTQVLARNAPQRATTLLDFERLALEVPGTQIARARAWSGIDVNYPCLQAPGTVTVIIVPYLPQGRPQPSPGLLNAVYRYLDRRKVIATRLVIVGPTYLEVRVQAQVRIKAGAKPERVQADITIALNHFLDPLQGGQAQRGYPFGRDVYRSEILQTIDEVPGVDYIAALELIPGNGEAQCGNLCVPANWLVTPGLHTIIVT